MRSTSLARALAVAVSGLALVGVGTTPALAAPVVPTVPAVPTAPAVPAAPAPTPGDAAETSSHCPQTAAGALGWGEPTRRADFDGTALPPDWHAYGPEPGHDKQGTRTPEKITVADGLATLSADEAGNTAAMSWHPGQRYGRWEVCVRSDPGPGGYHPVILLWPVEENWPVGGEIDWMEIGADDRQATDFFLHYGADNNQEYGSVDHDATEWTAYALEWTPAKMTTFVNGKEWYSTTDTGHFPPGAMNMTVQLDLFPPAGGETAMQVDWTSQWALPESEPAELSLAPGAPATGQPDLHPDRTPKPLDELPGSGALPGTGPLPGSDVVPGTGALPGASAIPGGTAPVRGGAAPGGATSAGTAPGGATPAGSGVASTAPVGAAAGSSAASTGTG